MKGKINLTQNAVVHRVGKTWGCSTLFQKQKYVAKLFTSCQTSRQRVQTSKACPWWPTSTSQASPLQPSKSLDWDQMFQTRASREHFRSELQHPATVSLRLMGISQREMYLFQPHYSLITLTVLKPIFKVSFETPHTLLCKSLENQKASYIL